MVIRREAPESVDALSGIVDVSRETSERLDVFVRLLEKWQRAQNLIAPSTLGFIWTRHVADSAQICRLYPDARTWIDLGSGGGFPGLVVGILNADRPDFQMHLVEANSRKGAFLRTVIRETRIPGQVHVGRIEAYSPPQDRPVDVISARALAPLAELCGYAWPLMTEKTVAIFHKGRDWQREVDLALHDWNLDLVVKDSAVDDGGKLIEIRALQPIRKSHLNGVDE
ncbi:MAG: 16S rRNA (guanine(527)-N(7))-methyltransferase RsmG [Pseudomonadota bacterium]